VRYRTDESRTVRVASVLSIRLAADAHDGPTDDTCRAPRAAKVSRVEQGEGRGITWPFSYV
jgi:hypothetical protein